MRISLTVIVASLTLQAGAFMCSHQASYRALFKAGLPPNAAMLENPGDTDVLNYNLSVEAKPATSEILGTNIITAESKIDGLNQFHFRLRDNYTISAITLDGRPITFVRESQTTCRAVFDLVYNSGQQFALSITYGGVAVSRGFGSIEFGTRSNGQPYVFTLSEPFYCYTWWPAKEENSDKATLQIAVTVPNTMVVASNGLLQGVDPVSGSRSKYRWATNYPIAPYLVCFGATNFNTFSGTYNYTGGSMPLSFYIWPESDNVSNRNGWLRVIDMLATFKNLFGLYPFVNEKYGLYQFTFGGGMEHQTITGQSGFDEGLSSHELTHQWYGDMITCRSWEHIWLNEGFATYGAALWEEWKTGVSNLAALKSAMNGNRPSSVNGTVYRSDVTNINSIFSSTYSYDKASWVLHMLRHVVGDATYWNVLAEYRNQFAYKSAVTEDFRDVAESVSGKDLDAFFQQWIYEPGAPAYSWGWQSTAVNGKNYLMTSINQTSAATYGLFTLPIDIRPTVGGVKQFMKVQNDATAEWFVLPLTGPASACTFDEDVWILNTGVTNTGYTAGPPKVVEASPSPGSTVLRSTNQVKVYFHTPVTASAANFNVSGVLTGPKSFTYSYDAANNCAVLTFAANLPMDRYTVTVSDLITATNSGQRLDGEISGNALPSGNGVALGDAVLTFRQLKGTLG